MATFLLLGRTRASRRMPEGRYRYLASLLAKREAGSGSAESTTGDVPGAIPDNFDAILDRADGLIRDHPPPSASLEAGQCSVGSGGGRPPDISAAADDPGERSSRDRNNARAALLHHAGAALAKIGKGGKPLSPDERCAMEAIVIADGTRPSFLLDQARVSPDDPWVRDWSGAVGAAEDAIRPLARAVGRIQPRHGNASRFVGTGTLVDAAKGFVLTNYHVIYEAEHGFGVKMRHEADRIVVEGELEIDFLGEASSLEKCRFRICEVFLPPGYGAVFAGIDAAVCRIEEIDQKYVLPAAAKVLSAAPRYAQGSMSSLATIGFPGPPAMDSSGEVDWTFVVGELFGNAFGLKRLAPGRFTDGLGVSPEDLAELAISHDATTFGGASGSLVVAWLDTDAPAFALHFAGATSEANYALSFAAARDALAAAGAPFG